MSVAVLWSYIRASLYILACKWIITRLVFPWVTGVIISYHFIYILWRRIVIPRLNMADLSTHKQTWKSIRCLITYGDTIFVTRAKRFNPMHTKLDLNVFLSTWLFQLTTMGWKLSRCWLVRLAQKNHKSPWFFPQNELFQLEKIFLERKLVVLFNNFRIKHAIMFVKDVEW